MKHLIQNINNLGMTIQKKNELVDFDPDRLIKIAKDSTGLDDFGDMHWTAGFYASAEALCNQAAPGLARLYYKHCFLLQLQNRLSVVDFLKKNPTVADREINAPILIMGNPRTGTSILYEMLAQDPGLRAPLGWEVIFPAGFHGMTDTDRKTLAKCTFDLMMSIEPTAKKMHQMSWKLPTEAFMNLTFDYHGLLEREASRSFCIWLKRTLQILQGASEKRTWLIKSPLFVFAFDDVIRIFQGARIIYLHRDPACSMASLFGLLGSGSALDWSHLMMSHQSELDLWVKGVRKVIALRTKDDFKNPIVDVYFQHLMEKPEQEVERIYRELNMPLSDGVLKRVVDYLHIKPRHRYGKYRNSLDGCGFDRRAITQAFRQYIDFYSIPVEDDMEH